MKVVSAGLCETSSSSSRRLTIGTRQTGRWCKLYNAVGSAGAEMSHSQPQHVHDDSWTGPASAKGNARFSADSFENSCSQKLFKEAQTYSACSNPPLYYFSLPAPKAPGAASAGRHQEPRSKKAARH